MPIRSFERCSQAIYENILGEMEEEIGQPQPTREELEKEFPYDWPVIEEMTKEFKPVRCENSDKGRKALEILKSHHPDRYEQVRGRCWVGPEDRMLGGRIYTAEHVAVKVGGDWYSNIYFQGPAFSVFSPEEVAQTLDHEGIHIKAIENPEQYGIRKDRAKMVHAFPELFLEHVIEKEEKKSPLYKYRESKEEKMTKLYLRNVKVVWAAEPMKLIHTCMTGRKIVPEGI